MSFISTLYNEIVTGFESNVASYAKTIATTIKPIVAAAFALYILYIIYRMYSKKDAIYAEFFNMIGVFAIVGTFTFAGTAYYDSVIPFVKGAGDEIAIALGGSSDSMTTIDTIYNAFQKGIDTVNQTIEENKGVFDKVSVYFQYALPLILLYLAQFVFTVAITINLLIAKVMVSLLLSVGVIFFVFACFPATRSMFTSWTGLALNYIFLNVLYSLSAILAGDLFKPHLSNPDQIAAKSGVILIATVIIVVALNQIPTLVSSLTGGVGISPYSVGSLAGTAGKVGRLAKGALFGNKGGNKGLVNGAVALGKKTMGMWKNRGSGTAGASK